MQPFAKNYIDKAYINKNCYKCNKAIKSNNTTLKSIIYGKQKYGNPVCNSCSKGENIFIIKSVEDDEMEDKSIGSESSPSTIFTVREHVRINPLKQNKNSVRQFKKRRFI